VQFACDTEAIVSYCVYYCVKLMNDRCYSFYIVGWLCAIEFLHIPCRWLITDVVVCLVSDHAHTVTYVIIISHSAEVANGFQYHTYLLKYSTTLVNGSMIMLDVMYLYI